MFQQPRPMGEQVDELCSQMTDAFMPPLHLALEPQTCTVEAAYKAVRIPLISRTKRFQPKHRDVQGLVVFNAA